MNTIVMQMGEGQTRTLPQQLVDSQITSKNPYVSFAAKVSGTTVLVYTSGKIVFQGSKALELAQSFGYPLENSEADTPILQESRLIGSDEVGNGSYFGGIAVVASLVTATDHAFLRSLGVDDSKNLTDSKIRQIAPLLKEKIPHKALLLAPLKYNEVVGKAQKYNAVSVKVALHNQAIYLLLQEVEKPDKIVIDAFTSQKNYDKYLAHENNRFSNPLTFEEKAEGKYLAVAVSSIIARALFLENLENLGTRLGYHLPSGAGANADKVASHILTTHGMEGLNYAAKLHFANTQKAIALLK
ncbi:ribonuclease HIII [Streptococcus plurextorum]|uniref:ribonuclease HIII n=1 Tax=Streptococcus plurextorum TaxID=456876 RepID=UPI000404D9B7|nr:ribonuclease HIII [Streptococcus plurextorum]